MPRQVVPDRHAEDYARAEEMLKALRVPMNVLSDLLYEIAMREKNRHGAGTALRAPGKAGRALRRAIDSAFATVPKGIIFEDDQPRRSAPERGIRD